MKIHFFLIWSSDEIQAAIVAKSTPFNIDHNLTTRCLDVLGNTHHTRRQWFENDSQQIFYRFETKEAIFAVTQGCLCQSTAILQTMQFPTNASL